MTFKLSDFTVGDRVQLHPALDCWMAGDRYGAIVHISPNMVHVLCDRSNRLRKLRPCDIGEIVQ